MDVFDIFSDDDEELIEFIDYQRRPYIVRERSNPFEEFDDLDFFTRFRFTKETVINILEQVEQQIETLTDRNHSISPINQLLLTLRFYATGNFLLTAGDTIHVSKTTACRIVKKVGQAIASLAPLFIKMPSNEEEITESHLEFYRKARLPRIIGSIDCTHVKIQSPGGIQAEVFRNRKGYFSINVQTISSVDLKIIDIVARWPGSTHDQIIFDNSNIRNRLEANEFGNSLLVGDSGYANTMHVITPLLVANNELQQVYNESVRRTRNPVERQYGIWKRRFPILASCLRLKLENTLTVIMACAVLHNIAIDENEELPPDEADIVQNINFIEDILVDPPELDNVNNAREELLLNYFPMLLNQDI